MSVLVAFLSGGRSLKKVYLGNQVVVPSQVACFSASVMAAALCWRMAVV